MKAVKHINDISSGHTESIIQKVKNPLKNFIIRLTAQ